MKPLSIDQIRKLLEFRGYGNPNGRFWFVGMEEGGKSDLESLTIRANKFRPLEDLAKSHENFAGHNMTKISTPYGG